MDAGDGWGGEEGGCGELLNNDQYDYDDHPLTKKWPAE